MSEVIFYYTGKFEDGAGVFSAISWDKMLPALNKAFNIDTDKERIVAVICTNEGVRVKIERK